MEPKQYSVEVHRSEIERSEQFSLFSLVQRKQSQAGTFASWMNNNVVLVMCFLIYRHSYGSLQLSHRDAEWREP